MGVSWAGIKWSCIHATLEKAPVLLEGVRNLRRLAEVSCARLRHAADGSDLPPGRSGLGQMLEHAVLLRCAASVCLAFFAVRRASDIAGLRTSDVSIDGAVGVVNLQVRN